MKYGFFYIFCLSFVLGVIFRSLVYSKGIFAVVIISVSFLFLFGRKKQFWVVVFTVILSFGLGMLRYDIRDADASRTVYDAAVGTKITVEGIVSSEPDTRENSVSIIVNAKARILVRLPLYSEMYYGDKLLLEGVIKKPENFDSGDGNMFDYVSYLAKDEVYYQMLLPKVTVLARDQGNPVKGSLYALKDSFLDQLEKVIPSPHSALMGGLLLGTKESLGKDLQDDFRRAGIIHIVVLSGYNITIIADWIRKIFSFLPKNYGVLMSMLTVVLFAVMTGGEATVVRASIMTLLVIGAQMTRRDYDVTRALCLAGLLMVLHNPKIVVFDSSFQLSFMSTLGLIYVAPIVEKKLIWVTEKYKIREILTTTIATQMFILPLLLYKMGELSLVGVPVNLLILGFIPLTMLLGFCTGLLGFISVSLAWVTGGFTYFLLWYEIAVVELFAHLPFASVKVSYFPVWAVVLVYVCYLVIYTKIKPTIHLSPALSDRPSP